MGHFFKNLYTPFVIYAPALALNQGNHSHMQILNMSDHRHFLQSQV
jgi:hypothetical protein